MSWFSVPDSLTKLTGLVSSVGDQIKTAIDQAGASDQTAKNSNEYDLGVDNCAPWVSENPELKKHEPELKALVLQITAGPPDEVLASFLEAVPPNSNFDFDFEEESPRSLAAIKADPRLDDIRLKLVPLKMKDPELFKRYFYKVSIVRQEFYKGIQLAQHRKGTAGAAASLQSHNAPIPDGVSPLRGNEANTQVDIESALEHELKSSTSHSGGSGAAAALPAAGMAQSDFEAELEAAFS